MIDNHKTSIILKHILVYSEDSVIEDGFIKIKAGKIEEIGSMGEITNEDQYTEVSIPSQYKVIPGLIDIHIHGVAGADTMDATAEALETMTNALPIEGTTSFLATTITQEKSEIEKSLRNVRDYMEQSQTEGKAEILGIHLEGPFINKKRAGAQPVDHIVHPDVGLLKKWQELSKNHIKLVTLAPEGPGGLDLVRYLHETGVVASIGHSDATYKEMVDAVEAGATQVTHLFNQMRGLHHREPGVVGAAFIREELKAEMIADGIHVRPEVVQIAYQQKGPNGMILITDSMRAKCLKNGIYDLGGQNVTVQDGKAVLSDGTLAGSILRLGDAIKNIITYTECTLEDAVQMAAVNPAKQLQVYDRKGSIAVGKDADLVILDDDYNIFMTFCRGKIAFQKVGETQ